MASAPPIKYKINAFVIECDNHLVSSLTKCSLNLRCPFHESLPPFYACVSILFIQFAKFFRLIWYFLLEEAPDVRTIK